MYSNSRTGQCGQFPEIGTRQEESASTPIMGCCVGNDSCGPALADCLTIEAIEKKRRVVSITGLCGDSFRCEDCAGLSWGSM